MRYWDSSALVSLFLEEEPMSRALRDLAAKDAEMAVWWSTRSECLSGLERARRTGRVDSAGYYQARGLLTRLAGLWLEIAPGEALRQRAEGLLAAHPLSAADAFQLAAALAWCNKAPLNAEVVVLDERLREAAQKEGFTVLP